MAKSPKKSAVKKSPNEKIPNTSAEKEIQFGDLLNALDERCKEDASVENREKFSTTFSKYLNQVLANDDNISKYNILVLFDNTKMIKVDADQIYRAITNFNDKAKPILLVLLSGGGESGSAYLIGRLCREFSTNNKFVVVVPRHAKSAATLLACAADEIHMGSLSELGPIDPQINGMPALGLKNSIEHIADLVSKNPGSSEMFAKYLALKVEPVQIGYYERVAQSSVQYAERLLEQHANSLADKPSKIADKLVYGYKDHGFVINKEEALSVFGANTVKCGTAEYETGNRIYNVLSRVERFAELLDHSFFFIGSLDSDPQLLKRRGK